MLLKTKEGTVVISSNNVEGIKKLIPNLIDIPEEIKYLVSEENKSELVEDKQVEEVKKTTKKTTKKAPKKTS